MEHKFSTNKGYDLTLKDLKEGHFYMGTLRNWGTVLFNECLYTVVNGKVKIHRSANWEDIPTSSRRPEDFMDHAFPNDVDFSDFPCFRNANSVNDNF